MTDRTQHMIYAVLCFPVWADALSCSVGAQKLLWSRASQEWWGLVSIDRERRLAVDAYAKTALPKAGAIPTLETEVGEAWRFFPLSCS